MGNFVGQVYDLDYIANADWCQALLRNAADSVAVVTKDQRAVTILATAMSMQRDAEVEYQPGPPNELTRAKLNLG